jgi:glycosyltransferase involved in cell wall biosynthesis
VVQRPHNLGYGSAIKAGILHASNDTIAIIDADLTYPVDAIPVLLTEFGKGFDMVVGARTGEHYRESALKAPLRSLLKLLVEYTAERDVPDVNSGLRIFSKRSIEPYLSHLCDTFSFTTSLTLAYMMTGRFVKYVPIAYHERVGQTKVRLFKDALRTLQYVVQSMIYYNPLRIFILMSMLCVGVATLSFAAGAILGLNAPYYLGIGGLLMALLIFSLGLLADLLRQIMAKR